LRVGKLCFVEPGALGWTPLAIDPSQGGDE